MSRIRSASRMTSIVDIDAQIQELHRKRRELQAKQAERLGRLALASGLGEFEQTDEELKAAFAEVATRFRPRLAPANSGIEAPSTAKAADPAGTQ